jgi:DNA-binding FrmR family transcriptional regulator
LIENINFALYKHDVLQRRFKQRRSVLANALHRFLFDGISEPTEKHRRFSPHLSLVKESAKLEKSKKNNKSKSAHGGIEVNHEKQQPRLSRIEGQVRGLGKMITDNRDCLEIVHQISAIINALRRVQKDMLGEHLAALGEAIIAENLTPQKRREMADELSALLKQLS